jgi:2-polyprenyl-6-methoxyphenol hydroxylase-like FAD-dependent oxidoreductase
VNVNVAVVGGGIGGLSVALALVGDGHQVTVVERAERFEAVGAGIVLAPNAVHVLAALGVDLAGAGRALARMEVRAATGDPLNAVDLRELARRHGPTYGIARPVLHARLAAALPPSVEVVLGAPVTSVRETGDGVVVELPGTQRRFDVVVAADGLRSAVRPLIGGPGDLRYSGTTCWRGVLPLPAGDVAVEAWGAGTRVGVVPVDEVSAYYYLVRSASPGEPGPASADLLRAAFAGYRGIAGEVVRALTQLPPLHHDLFELDRPFWGRSRVLLLGDAAHAMTPNQGQGAAMAIEDAAALVAALRGGVAGAARRYADLRGSRVRRVQLTSRRIGMVAHLGGARARPLRDAVMRLAPAGSGTRAVQRLIAPGIALASLPAPTPPGAP